jgi:hypothetical protein
MQVEQLTQTLQAQNDNAMLQPDDKLTVQASSIKAAQA